MVQVTGRGRLVSGWSLEVTDRFRYGIISSYGTYLIRMTDVGITTLFSVVLLLYSLLFLDCEPG